MSLAARAAGERAGGVVRRGDGWPIDRYAVIERAWAGCTAVCLGGGPSLTTEQVEKVRQAREQGAPLRVIAINNAYELAPWADVLYFADTDWHEQHRSREAFRAFKGLKVSIEPTGARIGDPDVLMLRNMSYRKVRPDFSEEPDTLATGSNGGFQVVNFSVLAGALRVLLLGYDMKPAKDGRTNWHKAHRSRTPPGAYKSFRNAFKRLPPILARLGVEVVNCTPDSALEYFPRRHLEDELAGLLLHS